MSVKGPNDIAHVVMVAVVYFTFRLAADFFLPSDEGTENLEHLLGPALGWAVVSTALTVGYARLQLRQYELRVDENELRVTSTCMDRSIHRGQIRTLMEENHGLIVSSRGKVGAYLWGGVLISRALPEYEQLKRLAESWKVAA